MFELNGSLGKFTIENEFTDMLHKVACSLGGSLVSFGIADYELGQLGVLQLDDLPDFSSSGSMIDSLYSERGDRYSKLGSVDPVGNIAHRMFLIKDYLLSLGVCYVEIPKWENSKGVRVKTYDKGLYTRNMRFIAKNWLSLPYQNVKDKYGPKLDVTISDFNRGYLKALSLSVTKACNKVVIPRSPLYATEVRVVPLFVLDGFFKGLFPVLENSIVSCEFMKDNGTIRKLDTTLSEKILSDYYSDDLYIERVLGSSGAQSISDLSIGGSSKINRGHVMMPELGASIYDGSGLRALNFARLISLKEVGEVDKTFINVDLDSVSEAFTHYCVDVLMDDNKSLLQIYKDLCVDLDINLRDNDILVEALIHFVNEKIRLLSTSYKRELYLYMISHEEIFINYRGQTFYYIN